MRIVIIGSGKVATNLVHSLKSCHDILQIYSRRRSSAKVLAQSEGVSAYTDELSQLIPDADLYLIAIKDDAVAEVSMFIRQLLPNALLVHTAGSLSIDTISSGPRGVFYPMQTFSKQRFVDFRQVSIFIEASSSSALYLLHSLAESLQAPVYELCSPDRAYLHVAAVFMCNFSNHLAALSSQLLQRHGIPFSVMLPLFDETAKKLHSMSPFDAQTGPAVRNDEHVMKYQCDLLSSEPDGEKLKFLYSALSDSIVSLHKN